MHCTTGCSIPARPCRSSLPLCSTWACPKTAGACRCIRSPGSSRGHRAGRSSRSTSQRRSRPRGNPNPGDTAHRCRPPNPTVSSSVRTSRPGSSRRRYSREVRRRSSHPSARTARWSSSWSSDTQPSSDPACRTCSVAIGSPGRWHKRWCCSYRSPISNRCGSPGAWWLSSEPWSSSSSKSPRLPV